MNYTEMLFNRDERLVDLLNQADSKNLELIVEINNREEEIERLKKELNKYRFRPKTRFSQVIELRDRISKAINDKNYIAVKEYDKKVKELKQEIERLKKELEEEKEERDYYQAIVEHWE